MSHHWSLRCPPPTDLVRPVPIDPLGLVGPTAGAARGRDWRRTSPRLYVPSEVDSTRVEQRIMEAAQRLPDGGAVTGWASLRLHGGTFFDGGLDPLPVPLVAPPGRDLSAGPGHLRIRARLEADDIVELCGIPCTRPDRAVLDEVWRVGDLRAAVVVVDMATAARILPMAALHTLAAQRGLRGIGRLREALPLADSRSKSPAETAMRLVWVIDCRLPRPLANWPVADLDGRFLGSPDLLSEELAVIGEYDGRDHRGRARHADDVSRDDRFRNAGLEVFRVVGPDMRRPGLVAARMLNAVRRAAEAQRPRAWMRASRPPPLRVD